VIRLEGIAIHQGAFALDGLALHVPRGAYGVLMGKSGCGKSTILEIVCGLRRMLAGSVFIGGVDVTRLRPGDRGVGYVPQDRALFPGLRVRDQIAFSLVVRRWTAARIEIRVAELGRLLGISHILGRYPENLSGGEAQRVALGRALAYHPRVLCLDEPLSALDEDLRDEMSELLAAVHRVSDLTVLHVTHSQREAERLGTVRLRLEDGKIIESSALRSPL
jgi:molybdate/tungstate transport system ATP-binding protein